MNSGKILRLLVGCIGGAWVGFYTPGVLALAVVFILAGVFEYSDAHIKTQMLNTDNLQIIMSGALAGVLIIKG